MSKNKPVFFKNLDGLRAIAAFAVIFAHLTYWFDYPDTEFFGTLKFFLSFGGGNGGRLGVIFFFILSGFLITFLMYDEQANCGKLNVLNFYARRILRIWPLYYMSLVVGFIIYPWIVQLFGNVHHENASGLWYSIFAANFDHIYHGYPSTGILGVQWSVAVEEQFYLLWPLLFFLFNKKRYFPIILMVIIFLSELFSAKVTSLLPAGDYHFASCIRYLSFGGLIAFFCYHKIEQVKLLLLKINKSVIVFIYLACFTLMILQNTFSQIFSSYQYLYHIIPVLFFGFVIIEQNFSENSFFKIGSFPLLNWLGKISFGLYLTHMVAINIVLGMFPKSPDYVFLKVLLSISICILISYLSYTYVEKYFLSFKNKFSFATIHVGSR